MSHIYYPLVYTLLITTKIGFVEKIAQLIE